MVAVDPALASAAGSSPLRGRRLHVRRYLVLMLAAVAVPLLALTGLVSWRYAEAQREHFEAEVAAAAQVILAVTEREVLGLAETLRALATSPSLLAGDLESFHRQSVEIARVLDAAIVLRDRDGRQVANSLLPWGAPLPARSNLALWDQAAWAASGPIVSDHYVGITGGAHSFAVVMAVRREGEPVYLLHIGLAATRLRDALLQIGVGEQRVGIVTDGRGIVLARTRDHDRAVGTSTTVASSLPARGGMTRGRAADRDGNVVFFVAKSSPATGLIAMAAARLELLAAERRRAVLLAAGTAALLIGLSLAAARIFSAPLDQALGRLVASGAALGRREPVDPSPEAIVEIEEVRCALQQAARDIREHEAERELILRELDHRVKNLLATVLSLAALTAREDGDAEAFRSRLVDRLRSLSRTHDLLIKGGGTAVGLDAVLRAELSMHDNTTNSRITTSGPPIALRAPVANALGMIVHELATNAAKYGALSTPQGRVEVSWLLDRTGNAAPLLQMHWIESGGPAVSPPTRSGFGSHLIERGLARQLRAFVSTEYAREGVRFRLAMPLSDNIEASKVGVTHPATETAANHPRSQGVAQRSA